MKDGVGGERIYTPLSMPYVTEVSREALIWDGGGGDMSD